MSCVQATNVCNRLWNALLKQSRACWSSCMFLAGVIGCAGWMFRVQAVQAGS